MERSGPRGHEAGDVQADQTADELGAGRVAGGACGVGDVPQVARPRVLPVRQDR